jgi:hypothetical protein
LEDIKLKKAQCDTSLESTKTEKANKDSQNGLYLFGIIVSVIINIFLGLKLKPMGKFGKHPVQEDTSKDFDKIG